jgi:hypothetical protein
VGTLPAASLNLNKVIDQQVAARSTALCHVLCAMLHQMMELHATKGFS